MYNSKFKFFSLLGLTCIFLLLWVLKIEAQTNRGTKVTRNEAISEANIVNKQSLSEVTVANELYYDGRYAEAAKAYEAILDKYAEFEYKDQVRTRLGRCYEQLNNDALAISMCILETWDISLSDGYPFCPLSCFLAHMRGRRCFGCGLVVFSWLCFGFY